MNYTCKMLKSITKLWLYNTKNFIVWILLHRSLYTTNCHTFDKCYLQIHLQFKVPMFNIGIFVRGPRFILHPFYAELLYILYQFCICLVEEQQFVVYDDLFVKITVRVQLKKTTIVCYAFYNKKVFSVEKFLNKQQKIW